MGDIGVLEEVMDDSLLTLPSRASFRFSCSSKTGDITVTCDCQAAIDAAGEACCCGHGAILFDLFKSQSHGLLQEEGEPQEGGEEEEDSDGIREFEFEFEFHFPPSRMPLQQLLPDNLNSKRPSSSSSSHHHSGTDTLPDSTISCYNWKPCLHSDAQSSRIKIKGPANHAHNRNISSSKQKRQGRHGHHEKWATLSVFTFRAPEAFIKSLLGLVTKTKLQNLHMNEANDHQCMMIPADSCKLRVDDHHDEHVKAQLDCTATASNPRGTKHKSLMAFECLNRYLIKPVNHLLSNKPHLHFHHVKKTLSGATMSGMSKFRKSGQIHNREEEIGDELGPNPNNTSSSSARRTPSFSRRLRGNYPQLWRANSFPLKRTKGAPKCGNDAHQSNPHHLPIISSSDAHNGIQSAIAYCKQSATI